MDAPAPFDADLVERILAELKSQGLYDRLRKDFVADVDTKPAYQNLRQRLHTTVSDFLAYKVWKPDMSKNKQRDDVRKHVFDMQFLDNGVDCIINQVINPKVYAAFVPQVEEVVCNVLGIEKPTKDSQEAANGKQVPSDEKYNSSNSSDEISKVCPPLLPADLDPVSPGEKFDDSDDLVSSNVKQEDSESAGPYDDKMDVTDNSDTQQDFAVKEETNESFSLREPETEDLSTDSMSLHIKCGDDESQGAGTQEENGVEVPESATVVREGTSPGVEAQPSDDENSHEHQWPSLEIDETLEKEQPAANQPESTKSSDAEIFEEEKAVEMEKGDANVQADYTKEDGDSHKKDEQKSEYKKKDEGRSEDKLARPEKRDKDRRRSSDSRSRKHSESSSKRESKDDKYSKSGSREKHDSKRSHSQSSDSKHHSKERKSFSSDRSHGGSSKSHRQPSEDGKSDKKKSEDGKTKHHDEGRHRDSKSSKDSHRKDRSSDKTSRSDDKSKSDSRDHHKRHESSKRHEKDGHRDKSRSSDKERSSSHGSGSAHRSEQRESSKSSSRQEQEGSSQESSSSKSHKEGAADSKRSQSSKDSKSQEADTLHNEHKTQETSQNKSTGSRKMSTEKPDANKVQEVVLPKLFKPKIASNMSEIRKIMKLRKDYDRLNAKKKISEEVQVVETREKTPEKTPKQHEDEECIGDERIAKKLMVVLSDLRFHPPSDKSPENADLESCMYFTESDILDNKKYHDALQYAEDNESCISCSPPRIEELSGFEDSFTLELEDAEIENFYKLFPEPRQGDYESKASVSAKANFSPNVEHVSENAVPNKSAAGQMSAQLEKPQDETTGQEKTVKGARKRKQSFKSCDNELMTAPPEKRLLVLPPSPAESAASTDKLDRRTDLFEVEEEDFERHRLTKPVANGLAPTPPTDGALPEDPECGVITPVAPNLKFPHPSSPSMPPQPTIHEVPTSGKVVRSRRAPRIPQQRYDSSDLYKPRLSFATKRQRDANAAVNATTGVQVEVPRGRGRPPKKK